MQHASDAEADGDTLTRQHRWTVAEWDELVESGVLDSARVETDRGLVVEMSPQGPTHQAITKLLHDLLTGLYGDTHVVFPHATFRLQTDPGGWVDDKEPDIVVARGVATDYLEHLPVPAEALLVAEVSRTTITKDRRRADRYAEAGVPLYLLVDVTRRCVERYETPAAGAYESKVVVGAGGEIVLPEGKSLAVDGFLP